MIKFCAECRACKSIRDFDTARERDDYRKRHQKATGHPMAVYITTLEPAK